MSDPSKKHNGELVERKHQPPAVVVNAKDAEAVKKPETAGVRTDDAEGKGDGEAVNDEVVAEDVKTEDLAGVAGEVRDLGEANQDDAEAVGEVTEASGEVEQDVEANRPTESDVETIAEAEMIAEAEGEVEVPGDAAVGVEASSGEVAVVEAEPVVKAAKAKEGKVKDTWWGRIYHNGEASAIMIQTIIMGIIAFGTATFFIDRTDDQISRREVQFDLYKRKMDIYAELINESQLLLSESKKYLTLYMKIQARAYQDNPESVNVAFFKSGPDFDAIRNEFYDLREKFIANKLDSVFSKLKSLYDSDSEVRKTVDLYHKAMFENLHGKNKIRYNDTVKIETLQGQVYERDQLAKAAYNKAIEAIEKDLSDTRKRIMHE